MTTGRRVRFGRGPRPSSGRPRLRWRLFYDTDWARIVALYDQLLDLQPTPFVALNRAVAVAMADGPTAALPLLDQLIDDVLRGTHRIWAVGADLHRRPRHRRRRSRGLQPCVALVGNDVERRYLAAARQRLPPNRDQRG